MASVQKIAGSLITFGDWFYLWSCYSYMRECLTKSRPRIIVYHRVADARENPWSLPAVNPIQFERQIRYICLKYRVLSLGELVDCIREKGSLPYKSVIITFDDGYKDNYLHAYPILQKHNVPATIFLSTDYINSGNVLWWDKVGYVIYNTRATCLELDGFQYSLQSTDDRRTTKYLLMRRAIQLSEEKKACLIDKLISLSGVEIPSYMGKELMLSWQEIMEMARNNIAFGAHTVTHPIMSKISSEQARNEIIQSKRIIEEKLNLPVTEFSYPNGQFGDFNTDNVRLLRENGLKCAVTTIPKLIDLEANPYELGRLGPGKNLHELKFLVFGPYSDLNAIYNVTKSIVRRFNY